MTTTDRPGGIGSEDWRRRREVIRAVVADIGHTNQLHGTADEQFFRRTMVRTTFSLLDAYCHFLKQEVLIAIEHARIAFSERKLRVLRELRTDETGVERPYYPSIDESLRVSICAYALVREGQVSAEFRHLPNALRVAKAARHRITHPKSVADLVVSDADIAAIGSLLRWFEALFEWMSSQDGLYIEALRQRSHEMWAAARRRIETDVARIRSQDD